MSDLIKTLGENVSRLRNDKGLSQESFCSLLGISEMELAAIEEGATDVDTGLAYQIAMALGVGIEDIFCSDKTRNQLLERIKNKFSLCSEKDLVMVFEYLTQVLKK